MRAGLRGSGALAVSLCLGAAAVCGAALAHDPPGEKPATPAGRVALARHDNFQRLGEAFEAINSELRKARPDRAAIARHAEVVHTLSDQMPTWFPKGAGQEAWAHSESKAEIWSDAAGFSAATAAAGASAAKLRQAATEGDLAATRAEARETDAACKACHARYRVQRG